MIKRINYTNIEAYNRSLRIQEGEYDLLYGRHETIDIFHLLDNKTRRILMRSQRHSR